jgi:hypothetical protein
MEIGSTLSKLLHLEVESRSKMYAQSKKSYFRKVLTEICSKNLNFNLFDKFSLFYINIVVRFFKIGQTHGFIHILRNSSLLKMAPQIKCKSDSIFENSKLLIRK